MKKSIKRIVGIVSALTIGTASMVSALTFSDITGHWAEANITALTEKGIINGYDDGTFKPNGTIKKGEFMKLMMTAALPDEVWDTTNTNYNHWSGTYINAAEREDLISVGTITAENANEEITRGEVVEILGKCDIMIREVPQEAEELEFYDISNMTDVQKAMLRHCVSVGYITGYEDATFQPEKTLSRAEVATILARYLAKQ